MGKPLLMLIYYNGRAIDEEAIENGVRLYGPAPKSMMIKRSMTLDSLKEKNSFEVKALENQVVSRIVYRIPQLLSSTKWTVIEIDKDGVSCMIDTFLYFPQCYFNGCVC